MIALRVYSQGGTPYYIDLYEEDGVKLNFSIEDITSTDAKSTFSRTFRVPSTGTNNEFFNHAFLIEGLDYDVTVKVPAEIEVGGAFFRSGHIRLQKIYVNEDKDGIDYELLFLGETRDFASVLGEAPLCELDGSSLVHTLNYNNIVNSWNAYPENPALTDGLLDGDVLYPLIDHGNTYDDDGDPEQSTIKTNVAQHAFSFTQNSHPLFANRFKPMIRAKKIIDLIFASTPYTYTSNFINSAFFHKIYVSAFGNESTIFNQETETQNIFRAETAINANNPGPQGGILLAECPVEIYDPGNNYNNTGSSSPQPFAYEIPISGTFTFTGTAYIATQPDWGTGTSYGRVSIFRNGSAVSFGNWVTNSGISNTTYTGAFNAGDYVQLYIETSPNTDYSAYTDAMFRCTAAPGIIEPTFQLDCEYKQVDFLKDILKLFRCVMAPEKGNPNNFIIEPWVDYIGSGDLYNWSDKVDRTKDFQIEPLFFTQSDRIEFKFKEDEDWLNAYNQDAYKQVYGQLNFDSQNELLKDTRTIEVAFSPTPTKQIEGDPSTSDWIIPQIHAHDSEGGNTLHDPIKPNTRILFYNGMQSTTDTWYFSDGTTVNSWNEYPAVNYQEGHPPFALTGLNINWDRWFAYYGDNVSGWDEYAGQSLFERYWSGYIQSLYNKYARRVTCHVVLNSVDLQDFSFDDVIYIDGVYYRPEKIIDAPVGDKQSVKVQLIKLLDYRPDAEDLPDPVDWCYYTAAQSVNNCTALSSTFVVIQAPCNLNLQPGDFVSVNGYTACFNILGPASTQIWDYTAIANYGTDCETCNDDVVNDQYTYWVRQYGATCNDYLTPWISVQTTGVYTAGDVVGLTLRAGCWEIVGITYQTPVDTIAQSFIDCESCLGGGPIEYNYEVENCQEQTLNTITSTVPYTIGQSVTLNGISGCWFIKGIWPGTGAETVASTYRDCADCLSQNPQEYYYNVTQCDSLISTVASSTAILSAGESVELNGVTGCWEVQSSTTNSPFYSVSAIYTDCPTCKGLVPSTYVIEECGGGRKAILDPQGQTLSAGQSIQTIESGTQCWEVLDRSNQPPNLTLAEGPWGYAIWTDCAACQVSGTYGKYHTLRSCSDPSGYKFIDLGAGTALGKAMTIDGSEDCWEVVGTTTATPTALLDTFYDDCEACQVVNPPTYYYQVANCWSATPGSLAVSSTTAYSPGDNVKLNRPGCWTVSFETAAQPTFDTIIGGFADCATCRSSWSGDYAKYKVEKCDEPGTFEIWDSYALYPIGTVVNPVSDGVNTCWTIIEESDLVPVNTVWNSHVSCDACLNP